MHERDNSSPRRAIFVGIAAGVILSAFLIPGVVLHIKYLRGSVPIYRVIGLAFIGALFLMSMYASFNAGTPRTYEAAGMVAVLAGALFLVIAIPAFLIQKAADEDFKRPLQIALFAVSFGACILYARFSKEFKTFGAKAAFVATCSLFPSAIVELLF